MKRNRKCTVSDNRVGKSNVVSNNKQASLQSGIKLKIIVKRRHEEEVKGKSQNNLLKPEKSHFNIGTLTKVPEENVSNKKFSRPIRNRRKSCNLDSEIFDTTTSKRKTANKKSSSPKRKTSRPKVKACGQGQEVKTGQLKKRNEKEKSLRKKRNSERRKEKSRDAARCRRGKESVIFGELSDLLPLDGSVGAGLDKASVIRIAIAYLRTRSLVTYGLEIPSTSAGSERNVPSALEGIVGKRASDLFCEGILAALDGFLIVLTKESEIVYTSENISAFLGLSQIDVMGHSLLDYTHPCDHEEVRRLSAHLRSGSNSAFLRFKCTISPKGRSVNLKSATYKVVQVTGEVLGPPDPSRALCDSAPSPPDGPLLLALGVPVPHPSNIEIPLDKQTFVSKHSLDMKFIYVDDNVTDFCGYRPEDLLGTSLYQLNHALDTHLIREAYKILRFKGQVETGRYRLLSRGGGYVWVVTQATLITGHRDQKPEYVVCLNYVISKTESAGVIFSECQLKAAKATESLCASSATASPALAPQAPFAGAPPSGPGVPPRPCLPKPSPVAATCSLLRDRTEDMNQGYLTFTGSDSHITVLKEEPEDLTHLAPSVGDDCVPLQVPTFIPGLDDFLEPSTTEFELSKPQISSGFGLKDEEEQSLESLLSDGFSSLTDTQSKVAPSAAHGQTTSRRQHPLRIPRREELLREQARSRFYHKVPDQEATSPTSGSGSPRKRFDTPEPPLSPLLSQTASPQSPEKYQKVPWGPKPTPSPPATRLFAPPAEESPSQSSMDLFNTFDLKLEEDLELRAPYIHPIDDVLVLDHDDLFGLSGCHGSRDTSPFGGSRQSRDEGAVGGSFSSIALSSYSPSNSSFQQNNLGSDTGGSFVDPNQVLPGQYYAKDEEKDNLQELRYLLEAPPPSPVQDPVDSPPPLKGTSSSISGTLKGGLKRPSTPPHVTSSTKKLRFPSGPLTAPALKKEPASPERDLLTPHAPLMQQLLVSKEPICVRGRTLSQARTPSASGDGCTKKPSSPGTPHSQTHSVLRNLLVSGRDERAGYAVLVATAKEANTADKSDEEASMAPDSSLHSFPLNKEGKVELTRQQLAALLDRAGVLRPSFRGLRTSSNSLTPRTLEERQSRSHPPGQAPSSGTLRERSSLLSLDTNFATIPTLFDLTSFDCEVNAPAPDPSLLQGSELLMALEQSQ